jgi:3-oxoacyl-[acyl-carrier-protein] synthase-3
MLRAVDLIPISATSPGGMQYHNVCLESFGHVLPDEIVTSAEIEQRLAPLYRRLRLPEGRLELMSGIRERRFWARGERIAERSAQSAERALAAAGIDRREVGMLVHASVCRDFLEPATACEVHRRLGLRPDCQVYDVSNACLGFLNAAVQVANAIELGQVRAGLVVGTESARRLVESTIAELNENTSLSRDAVKPAMASLTIGSASAALLLVDRELSRDGERFASAAAWADTSGAALCQGGAAEGGERLLMATDAEELLQAGIAAAESAFGRFLESAGWRGGELDKTICHQVGHAHRRRLLEALRLDAERDFVTYPWLGNTGSAALPVTLAVAAERGHFSPGDRVGLLGIGSGINVLMLALEWQSVARKVAPTAAGPTLAVVNGGG